jgi:hypothetical protein
MHNSSARTQKKKQNLESRAKRALYKDPHLRSSPLRGEGKKRGYRNLTPNPFPSGKGNRIENGSWGRTDYANYFQRVFGRGRGAGEAVW